jgi:hypothetical protein
VLVDWDQLPAGLCATKDFPLASVLGNPQLQLVDDWPLTGCAIPAIFGWGLLVPSATRERGKRLRH